MKRLSPVTSRTPSISYVGTDRTVVINLMFNVRASRWCADVLVDGTLTSDHTPLESGNALARLSDGYIVVVGDPSSFEAFDSRLLALYVLSDSELAPSSVEPEPTI